MSSADLWEDGYPHGTVEGYDGGCRGGACPGALDYGMSCKRAKTLSNSDIRYNRLARAGKTPAEIAQALAEQPTTAHPAPPDRDKRHLKALERELADDTAAEEPHTTTKETRMPTPNDVAHARVTIQPLPVDEETQPAEAARTETTPAPAPAAEAPEAHPSLTTDRWTAGLTHRAKTAKLHEIREWARANGFPDLPSHGKIPQDALAAYARFDDLLAKAGTPIPATTPDVLEPRQEEALTQDEIDEAAAEIAAESVEEHGIRVDEAGPVDDGKPAPADATSQPQDGTRAEPDATGTPVDPSAVTSGRACRQCGCTDWDCAGCIERTGSPCSWVADDLCSACVPAAVEPAEFDEAMEQTRTRADIAPTRFPDLDLALALSLSKTGARFAGANVDDDGTARVELLEHRGDDTWWNLTTDRPVTVADIAAAYDDVVITDLGAPDAPDDFRPDWAGVTIPAAIRQARTFAARVEEQNAELTRQLVVQADELATVNRSLALVLRKWGEATEKLDQLADAEEQLDVAAQRIENQEHTIRDLQVELDVKEAIIDRMAVIADRQPAAPKRSPWWSR
ncbi:MAG: Lsr2 family DNA-binding protein [Aquihabitans sp.]